MNSGQLTAIVIVAIIMFASVIRAGVRTAARRGIPCGHQNHDQTMTENSRLREQVQGLTERIKVLERITVDKENSLSRQIEELRDR